MVPRLPGRCARMDLPGPGPGSRCPCPGRVAFYSFIIVTHFTRLVLEEGVGCLVRVGGGPNHRQRPGTAGETDEVTQK